LAAALQVIKAILEDPDDETECWLLYSNETEGDIMARDMIEDMFKSHPQRFIRYYTLTGSDKPEGWNFGMGRISDWMVTLLMPKPDNQTLITMCGPAGFCYETCLPLLESVGHGVSVKHVF
jgi:NAD(P)H-flavin reductase